MEVEQIILPKRGYKSQQRQDYEHQDWFIEGRKWHAGVEGRISVLKRAHGLGRCLYHGYPGFQRWVGWGCDRRESGGHGTGVAHGGIHLLMSKNKIT
jgi:hypothetical protein